MIFSLPGLVPLALGWVSNTRRLGLEQSDLGLSPSGQTGQNLIVGLVPLW